MDKRAHPLPVRWTISHAGRLVVSVAKDRVTGSNIEKHFAAITADDAMPTARYSRSPLPRRP